MRASGVLIHALDHQLPTLRILAACTSGTGTMPGSETTVMRFT